MSTVEQIDELIQIVDYLKSERARGASDERIAYLIHKIRFRLLRLRETECAGLDKRKAMQTVGGGVSEALNA